MQAYEVQFEIVLRIQLLHKTSLRTQQQEKNYWKRFFIQFSTYLYKNKGYSDNYVSNTFKIIKTFFNYLQTDKGYMVGVYHKSFRVPIQNADVVVLQPEQLQFLIINKVFEEGLSFSLKRAKIFLCSGVQ